MRSINLSRNNFLYNLKKKLSKTNVFVLLGIFLFLLTSVITISTSIPIIKQVIEYKIFYKETMINNIGKLRAGTQITGFERLLGDPTFIFDVDVKMEEGIKLEPPKKEYIFVNKFYYVDALTDLNGNVTQFAVTTRDRAFNPRFLTPSYSLNGDHFDITLGKSKFKDLPQESDKVRGCVGAHNWYYFEEYYLGNPSNYQTYAFGFNMSGYESDKSLDLIGEYLNAISSTNCPPYKNFDERKVNMNALEYWRDNVVVNTYLITAPSYHVFPNNLGIGVYYNQVRTLDK